MAESEVSLDTGSGLRDNRKRFATDETNNVHTIRTAMSVGGSPVDGDNPIPVGDAEVLAQLVASNTALVEEVKRLTSTLIECLGAPVRQVVAHLELVTDTVFTPEDVED